MAEPTRDEMEAQLAAMQAQIAALETQLAAQKAATVSTGDRGVGAETVTDSQVVTGDDNRVVQTHTYIETLNQIIEQADSTDPASLRHAYLAHLYQQVGTLTLLGIDRGAANRQRPQLRLDAIYTALLTEESAEEMDEFAAAPQRIRNVAKRKPLAAVAQLNRHRQLVLLGEPGGGKSTFVNFVALCMAGELLQEATGAPSPASLTQLTMPLPTTDGEDKKDAIQQPWEHGPLLPVRVILRDFAARGLPPVGTPATAAHLWEFCCAEWSRAGLADCHELLRKELLERGGIFLLDGLDEVPEADQRRQQLVGAIEAAAGLFRRCRFLVTSRTYAYQQQAWRLNGFATTLLAPLTDGQIRTFVDQWYGYNWHGYDRDQRQLTDDD
ncbi:MAG TPA: NACHT domain-containing protein, partial [Caldilineaceae bacterium]|nr:NACHT domain-containing protein [Caldilineaceae bacterium]